MRGGSAVEGPASTAARKLPAHEADLLWRHVLGGNWLGSLIGEYAPSFAEQSEFQRLSARRLQGEPLQYITGFQGFRKLRLRVGRGVLVPRPETEMVAQRCLDLLDGIDRPKVLDVGTGSGAIALSLATERPDCEVWATESSPQAFGWAAKNAAEAGAANLTLLAGDLFGPLPGGLQGSFDLVVSNPPYLCPQDIERSAPDVRDYEPRMATVAGPSGLEAHRRLAAESPRWLRPGGMLVLETFEQQWPRLRPLLEAQFHEVSISPDLTGRLRVAEGRRP